MKDKTTSHVRRIAFDGLFAALAFGLSFVEFLLPLDVGVPGIKLGLANIVSLFVLYRFGVWDAAAVSLVRILLSGFMFSAPAMPYSLCGAALSLAVMALLKRTKLFSAMGVSVAGAVAHNLGQVACAVVLLRTVTIAWYFPVLLISGVLGGCAVGLLAAWMIKRFQTRIKL